MQELKLGKSQDPNGYVSELFLEKVIGSDLKMSLLVMFNKMKNQVTIPVSLRRANITIIHKKKGHLDLHN